MCTCRGCKGSGRRAAKEQKQKRRATGMGSDEVFFECFLFSVVPLSCEPKIEFYARQEEVEEDEITEDQGVR
jgi:hypothetical protein